MVTHNGDMTDNQAPPGTAPPRVHVKIPRIDYDAAKAAAAAAGVSVPVYLAGLIQADRVERARGAAQVLHILGVVGGAAAEWTAEADRAVDVAVRFE